MERPVRQMQEYTLMGKKTENGGYIHEIEMKDRNMFAAEDIATAKQVEGGREFMVVYREPFQALAE